MSDFTQKLTLKAEALGIPETARGLEMLTAAQERLAEVTKQLEQARLTGTFEDVKKLSDQQSSLNEAIGLMSGKQTAAAGTTVNFGEQLRRIHPLLGDAASALSRYGGVTAIVSAAITTLTILVRTMGEEFQKSTKAIEDQGFALDRIKKTEREGKQLIEDERARTKLGPFKSDREASDAEVLARRIKEKHGAFLSDATIAEGVALSTSGKFTFEETARIARMLSIPRMARSLNISDKTSPRNIEARLRRGLTSFRDELDKTFVLEADQAGQLIPMARQQVRAQGGSTLELREVIERSAPAGSNIDFLTKLAQSLGGDSERLETMAARNTALGGIPATIGSWIGSYVPGGDRTEFHATPADFAILRGVFQQLKEEKKPPQQPGEPDNGLPRTRPNWQPGGSMQERNDKTIEILDRQQRERERERAPGQPITQQFNGRYYGSDARAQAARTTNGQTILVELERMIGV